jgi:hypothetical protein
MATQSRIAVLHPDGKVESVLCIMDGYPSHNGVILLKNFDSYEKAAELVSGGNIVCIPPNEPVEYTGEPSIVHKGINDLGCYMEQYNYLYDGSGWILYDYVYGGEIKGVGLRLPPQDAPTNH